MMILTFNCIDNENTLIFNRQKYVRDKNNPGVFVSINLITSISKCGFENYKSLTAIVIPDSVTYIGDCAFQCCTSLTKIIIPESVTTIDNWAFNNCISLTTLVIPDSVNTIGYSVFVQCKSLTMVETNNEDAYIIQYCKKYYPYIEVIVNDGSYVLK